MLAVIGLSSGPSEAGCVKGAVIGGVAGHFVGHHEANRRDRERTWRSDRAYTRGYHDRGYTTGYGSSVDRGYGYSHW